MVINWLTKERYYILCTIDRNGCTAKSTTYLFLNNVWKIYSLLLSLISDQNPQFILEVWKNLCKIFGIKVYLSTVFYLKTDG